MAERGGRINVGADVEQCLELATVAALASGEMKCDGQTAEIGLQLNLGGEELLPRPPWADQLALQ